MIGSPKHLSTRYDWMLFINNFPESEWRPRLQTLYDERLQWLNTDLLESGEAGIEDATHRVLEIEDEQGTVTQRYQQEYMLDPNCALLRTDLTIAEVEARLGSNFSVDTNGATNAKIYR